MGHNITKFPGIRMNSSNMLSLLSSEIRQPDRLKALLPTFNNSIYSESGRPTAGLGSIMSSLITTSLDRKSTRLNSSHVKISYAVFCLKKKKKEQKSKHNVTKRCQ